MFGDRRKSAWLSQRCRNEGTKVYGGKQNKGTSDVENESEKQCSNESESKDEPRRRRQKVARKKGRKVSRRNTPVPRTVLLLLDCWNGAALCIRHPSELTCRHVHKYWERVLFEHALLCLQLLLFYLPPALHQTMAASFQILPNSSFTYPFTIRHTVLQMSTASDQDVSGWIILRWTLER
jgi:hypothetical protein